MANTLNLSPEGRSFSPAEIKLLKNKDFLAILSPQEFAILSPHFPSAEQATKIREKFLLHTAHISKKIAVSRDQSQNQWFLPTGIAQLDFKLNTNVGYSPGLPSQYLTLFYGKARSGKSQICHQLPVELAQLLLENPGKNVLFLDTEGTFRPSRIHEMAQGRGLSPDNILNRIISVQCTNYSSFNLTVSKIPELLESHPLKVIIIDSLTSVYRNQIAEHSDQINQIISNLAQNLQKLSQWAQDYNLVVCLTSQVSSTFEKTYFFDVIPILSTTLNRYIKNWVLLGENDQESEIHGRVGLRYAHLVNSENHPEEILKFEITSARILDFFS